MPSNELSKKGDKPKSDLKVVSRDEEAGTFVGEVFGEQFLFSQDVNGWLMFLASTGKAEHFETLLHSILLIPNADDMTEAELRVGRIRETDRFNNTLGTQRDFGLERMFRLVNDIIEAAGNANTDS